MPGRQIQTAEHQTFKETKKYITNFIDEDVTAEFHVTQDFYIKTLFDNWQNVCLNTNSYSVGFKSDYTTDVLIQQLAKGNNLPIYGVKLKNAFPTSLAAIPLNNESENIGQRFTVTFSYDRFEVDNALGSAFNGLKDSLGRVNTVLDTARNVSDRLINIL